MAKRDKDQVPSDSGESPDREKTPDVQAGGWDDRVKVRQRTFNGPAAADEVLRISMTKDAYADLIGHAKDSLDREICGVLLGDLCEDDYGRFLHIESTLRGSAAKTGGTHVTFTQETWNEIHTAKEKRFPKLQIVGWYHSHPGFGVEFSDMDLFIQKNFFGGPGQIAFVSDPLGGEEAIVANADGAITPVKRFWVDGRERRCYVPPAEKSMETDSGKSESTAISSDAVKQLDDLRDRVRQLTEAVEQQRRFFYNVLMFLGMLAACCFLLATGYSIYRAYTRPIAMPEDMALEWTVPVPLVDKDGRATMVTLNAKSWRLSPELEDNLWKVLLAQHKAEWEATTRAAAPATRAADVAPIAPAPNASAPKTP